MNENLKAVSLFCGCGGLDIGFHRVGIRTIFANDFSKDACETYRKWNPSAEVVCGDVGEIPESSIPDCDAILGGFPCQGFSLAGPRRIDDSRNLLYRHYVRIVRAKKPKVFVGENVKGILTMDGGRIIDAIVREFSDCGYDVFYKLVNAKNYGVPEDRLRVIITGFRKDLGVRGFILPETNGRGSTIEEALEGIPFSEDELCTESYSPRYMSRNRRRGWNDVSFTIPAMAKQTPLHPSSPLMEKIDRELFRFGLEGRTRRFTWRECAAIQTFPKEMEFVGKLDEIYRQIGNAVPPLLAESVAESVKERLIG